MLQRPLVHFACNYIQLPVAGLFVINIIATAKRKKETMSSMLSVLSLTIVIIKDGCGSIPRQLRQAFDLTYVLRSTDNEEFNRRYFKDGEILRTPKRVEFKYYQLDSTDRCRITVDSNCVLYDDKIKDVCVNGPQLRDRLKSCISCKRKAGFYSAINEDQYKSFNSNIVIKINNHSRYITELKTELAETLELINRVIATPSDAAVLKTKEIQEVLVTKTHTDKIKEASVTIDGNTYYDGRQNNLPSRDDQWCAFCNYFSAFGARTNFIC